MIGGLNNRCRAAPTRRLCCTLGAARVRHALWSGVEFACASPGLRRSRWHAFGKEGQTSSLGPFCFSRRHNHPPPRVTTAVPWPRRAQKRNASLCLAAPVWPEQPAAHCSPSGRARKRGARGRQLRERTGRLVRRTVSLRHAVSNNGRSGPSHAPMVATLAVQH